MTFMRASNLSGVLVFGFTVALTAASCVSAPRSTARAEVEVVVGKLVASVNSADAEGFMSLFASDASVFLPSAATPTRLTGLEQIRVGVSPMLESPPINPMAIRDLQITIGGGMALASFEIGNPIVHSRRTLVLQNTRHEWKIIHLHGSNLRAETK